MPPSGPTDGVHLWQWSVILLLFTWLVLPISIVIFLDWWRGYFFAIRQVLFATPALLLGAAIGLTHLFELARSGRRSGLVLTLILTGVLGELLSKVVDGASGGDLILPDSVDEFHIFNDLSQAAVAL